MFSPQLDASSFLVNTSPYPLTAKSVHEPGAVTSLLLLSGFSNIYKGKYPNDEKSMKFDSIYDSTPKS